MSAVVAAKILMIITTASAVPWGRFSTAYFVSKGISATQIGTLRLVGFFAKAFAYPIWGLISDYTQNVKFTLISSIFLCGLSLILLRSEYVLNTFALLIFIKFIRSGLNAVWPLTESMALLLIKGKGYGQTRMYCAISWGLCSFLVGYIIDRSSYGINLVFYLTWFIMFLDIIILIVFIPSPEQQPQEEEEEEEEEMKNMNKIVELQKEEEKKGENANNEDNSSSNNNNNNGGIMNEGFLTKLGKNGFLNDANNNSNNSQIPSFKDELKRAATSYTDVDKLIDTAKFQDEELKQLELERIKLSQQRMELYQEQAAQQLEVKRQAQHEKLAKRLEERKRRRLSQSKQQKTKQDEDAAMLQQHFSNNAENRVKSKQRTYQRIVERKLQSLEKKSSDGRAQLFNVENTIKLNEDRLHELQLKRAEELRSNYSTRNTKKK